MPVGDDVQNDRWNAGDNRHHHQDFPFNAFATGRGHVNGHRGGSRSIAAGQ